jgi:hypothetical protein
MQSACSSAFPIGHMTEIDWATPKGDLLAAILRDRFPSATPLGFISN